MSPTRQIAEFHVKVAAEAIEAFAATLSPLHATAGLAGDRNALSTSGACAAPAAFYTISSIEASLSMIGSRAPTT